MSLKAGFSRVCITPPLGTELAGYFRTRAADGVLDDLYLNTVVFENDGQRAVLISADLLYIRTSVCNTYLDRISERFSLPREAIFIACTHIHTGPAFGDSGKNAYAHGSPLYDEYTGLLNRTGVKKVFAERLEDMKKISSEADFVRIQLSGLNDSCYQGDDDKCGKVTAAFAKLIDSCVKSDEIFGKWSVYSFAVITPHKNRCEEIFRELSEKEGLFDEKRKQKIPFMQRMALVKAFTKEKKEEIEKNGLEIIEKVGLLDKIKSISDLERTIAFSYET